MGDTVSVDRTKHVVDVLEHVLGGVRTVADDESRVIVYRHDLANTESGVNVQVVIGPA